MKKLLINLGILASTLVPLTTFACNTNSSSSSSDSEESVKTLPFKLLDGTYSPEEQKNLNLTWICNKWKYIAQNEVGNSSPIEPFKDRLQIGGFFANMGDLSLGDAETLVRDYLNSIDDWYIDKRGYSYASRWIIRSHIEPAIILEGSWIINENSKIHVYF